MYLSRLMLNPRSRLVWRDLSNCHELHRTILRAFPQVESGSSVREALGVLYRVDTQPRGGQISLLVQSRVAPDWSVLSSAYLSAPDGRLPNPACKQIDHALDGLSNEVDLIFRLRANPTKRIKQQRDEATGKDWSGKRVELRTDEELNTWIRRKGEQGGFRVLSVDTQVNAGDLPRFREIYGSDRVGTEEIPDVRAAQDVKLIGYKGRGGPRLTFGSVLFDGRLRITDADRFRETLAQGVGSGKAYGFGLLSIAPAS